MTRRIAARDDEHALRIARLMAGGHAVELWGGLRFIDHFAVVESGFDGAIADVVRT